MDRRLAQLLGLSADARIYDLEQPRKMHAPTFPAHLPGHVFTLHRRHEPGTGERRTSASGMIFTAEHSGTHIDALCHQAEALHMYGSVEITAVVQTSTGFTRLGADGIEPIIKRGVLLDVAGANGGELPPRYKITDEDLRIASSRQGIPVSTGCVALVRTGYGAHWDDIDRYLEAPGVDRGGSEWLAEHEVHSVGIDNVVWDLPSEFDPAIGSTLPGHVILLVRAGIYILENANLEELAADNAHEFLFVCLPLKFEGGTGSPVRPIAIVPNPPR